MVTIRLARGGAKKRPFHHIVVKDSRRSRDGRFIERVGYFNPLATGEEQSLSLDLDRVNYWIGHGAQPSDRVKQLIRQASAQAASAGAEVESAPAAQGA